MLWLVIALIAAFLIFLAAPALFIFTAVFYRKKTKPFEEYDWEKFKDHYYVPFLGRIEKDRAFVKGHERTEISVTSHDGLRLVGDYYDLGFDRTAILFHGFNAEAYTNVSAHAAILMKLGFNVLIVIQRAHGRSGGRWSGIGLREHNDVLSWVSRMEQEGAKELLLYGVSMGAAAVAYASDRLGGTRVRGIVIDSGFYSVYSQMSRDVKKLRIPHIMLPAQYILAGLFLRINLKKPVPESLKNCAVPALFIHGTDDETVLFTECETNYTACALPKDILLVDGAPHTLSILTDEAAVTEALSSFTGKYF